MKLLDKITKDDALHYINWFGRVHKAYIRASIKRTEKELKEVRKIGTINEIMKAEKKVEHWLEKKAENERQIPAGKRVAKMAGLKERTGQNRLQKYLEVNK